MIPGYNEPMALCKTALGLEMKILQEINWKQFGSVWESLFFFAPSVVLLLSKNVWFTISSLHVNGWYCLQYYSLKELIKREQLQNQLYILASRGNEIFWIKYIKTVKKNVTQFQHDIVNISPMYLQTVLILNTGVLGKHKHFY